MKLLAPVVNFSSRVEKAAGKGPCKTPTKSGKYPRKTPTKPGASPRKTPSKASQNLDNTSSKESLSSAPYRSPAKRTLKFKKDPRTNGYVVHSPQPLSTIEESPQDDSDLLAYTNSQTSWQSRSHCIDRNRVDVSGVSALQKERNAARSTVHSGDLNGSLVRDGTVAEKYQSIYEDFSGSTSPAPSDRHLILVRNIDIDLNKKKLFECLDKFHAQGCWKFKDNGPAMEGFRRSKPTLRLTVQFNSLTAAQTAVRDLNNAGFHRLHEWGLHGYPVFAEMVEK